MAAPKGTRPPNAGKGRIPGVPNKATADARAAIAGFVDANAGRLQAWLDAVANGEREQTEDGPGKYLILPNPQRAFELFQSVIEYHVPKLARTELTGKDGKALKLPVVTVELHPGQKP